jgi:hypothetical protein
MNKALSLMGLRESNQTSESIYPRDLENGAKWGVEEVFMKTTKMHDGSKMIILGAVKDYGDKITASVTVTTIDKRGSSSGSILFSEMEKMSKEEAIALVKKYEKDLK